MPSSGWQMYMQLSTQTLKKSLSKKKRRKEKKGSEESR
jgi:hypothetical protein